MRGLLCRELIGRDQVLDTARTALAEAQRGAGGVVFVSGEAGVGKSRLVGEIVTAARESGVQVLFGRGVQADVPVPFRPFSEALLSHFRNQGLPDLPGLSPFRPALGRLLPEWRTPGETTHEPPVVLAEGVVRLLTAVAGESAALLVLEDLHWADQETLAVLEYLVDVLRTQPVLCVATVRSEEASAALRLLQGLMAARTATVLELDALATDDLGRMTAACLGSDDVPSGVVEYVRAWSDGLPFMVEEVLAGAVGAGALAWDGERWSFDTEAGPVVAGELRGQRARPAARARPRAGPRAAGGGRPGATLRLDAAASGRAGVRPRRDGSAPRRCRRAAAGRRARGAVPLPARADPGRRARRPAARRARARLPRRPRRGRGRAPGAARPVVRGGGRPGREVRASTSVPPACCSSSRRRSLAAGALGSAEQILDRARTATSDAALEADIDEVAAEVLALAGKTDQAIVVGSRVAHQLRVIDGPATRRTNAHLGVARAAVTACVWDTAEEHLARARECAADAADDDLSARVDTVAAQSALGQGQPEAALPLAERALATAESLGDHELACEALEVIGRCWRLSDAAASEQAFDRARVIAETHGLALWRTRAMSELAWLDTLTGGGEERLRSAHELALACGAWGIAAHLELAYGQWYLLRFRMDESIARLRRCAELAERLGMPVLLAIAHASELLVQAVLGRADAVERSARAARAAVSDEPGMNGMVWAGLGMLALVEEDLDTDARPLRARGRGVRPPADHAPGPDPGPQRAAVGARLDQRRGGCRAGRRGRHRRRGDDLAGSRVPQVRAGRGARPGRAPYRGRSGVRRGRGAAAGDGGRAGCTTASGSPPRRPSTTAGATRTAGCSRRWAASRTAGSRGAPMRCGRCCAAPASPYLAAARRPPGSPHPGPRPG